MTRRWWIALAGSVVYAEPESASIRGKLEQTGDGAVLVLADGKRVRLTGDAATIGVVMDKRLAGAGFEANGRFVASDLFRIEPIHKRNMFVHKDGRKLQISYWCSVCSIRTWSPGVCMCCQDETALDLKERFDP
ncbi:MAG: hypothetical protein R2729_11215 [Bryobacteraceae bacterium]